MLASSGSSYSQSLHSHFTPSTTTRRPKRDIKKFNFFHVLEEDYFNKKKLILNDTAVDNRFEQKYFSETINSKYSKISDNYLTITVSHY